MSNSKTDRELPMSALKITQTHIRNALKIALRTGRYFKLNSFERATLVLASKLVRIVKSQTLKEILLKIFEKISPKLTLKIKAFLIGLEIAKKRVEHALMLGYKKALSWMKDTNYILYLGFMQLTTPPIYRI